MSTHFRVTYAALPADDEEWASRGQRRGSGPGSGGKAGGGLCHVRRYLQEQSRTVVS